MAKLKCAKDGHYYILAGQSKGTWQVSDAALKVLARHNIRLPRPGDKGVEVGWLWRILSNNDLLFIHGIPYDLHDRLAETDNDDSVVGLPLLLQPRRTQPWSLAVEISAEAIAEAQEHRAYDVAVVGALARRTSIRQLQMLNNTVRVAPQSEPYTISWFDTLEHPLNLDSRYFAEGLNTTERGAVFAEGADRTWRLYTSENYRSIPFWGTLYWLAREKYTSTWPGKVEQWGDAQNGWRLWRLTTSAERPVTWNAIDNWLRQRNLALSHHTQHLHLITPPLAITEEGWSLVSHDQPLIIGCTPPERPIPGVLAELQLAVTRTDGRREIRVDGMLEPGRKSGVDKLWFARWERPQPGDYRIEASGSARVDPLYVRILPGIFIDQEPPAWLQGMSCRLSSGAYSETLAAFGQSAKHERPHITTFSADELSQLAWELQPPGLPIQVKWRPNTDSQDEAWRPRLIDSGEEFTNYWRETIWPVCAAARGVELRIEGDNFGRIECRVGLPLLVEATQSSGFAPAQRAELAWLTRLSLAPSVQPRIPVPADLRQAINRFHAESAYQPNATAMTAAITLLRAQQTIPAWIAPRLRALLATPPTQERTTSDHAAPREAAVVE